jgi:hypothetical protein
MRKANVVNNLSAFGRTLKRKTNPSHAELATEERKRKQTLVEAPPVNGASAPGDEPILRIIESSPNAQRLWGEKNRKLQTICGENFAQLINRAIPGSSFVKKTSGDYIISFYIDGHPAHISFHKRGIPGKEGAFHIKLDDNTVSVRLLLNTRPDNVLQFFPAKVISRGLTPEIKSEIINIIQNINRRLSACVFTAERVSPGGGSPMYGGTRRRCQQKKRYTRRSKY